QEWADELAAADVRCHEFATGLRRGHPLAIARLGAAWRNRRPDVVCAFGPTAIVAVRTVQLACPRAGIVFSVRNAVAAGSLRARFLRAAGRIPTTTVFNSAHVARTAVDAGLLGRAQAVVIYNGIDLTPFTADDRARAATRSALNVALDETLLLTVGHLTPQKNYPAFLRAFDRVATQVPGLQLRIAGRFHGAETEMWQQARARWTSGQIVALGSRSDVPDLLRAADVFVLPSLFEGSPNALAEAMASRLPVAATPVDGVTELIISPSHGWRTADTSEEAIEQTLLNMLSASAADRHARGQAARAFVEERYGVERMVDEFEALFARVGAGLEGSARGRDSHSDSSASRGGSDTGAGA
ncbi:MAG: glycosyltransferase involved in cell wall biosynthesis, partial [Bradymonadia bacterium]